MNQSIILHHYAGSPYSEKIRLMFGFANIRWFSLLSPEQPPRPNLDPLAGGYRRIPVAQIGSDIFCDTSLIAKELSETAQSAALSPTMLRNNELALLEQSETVAAFAALNAVPPYRLMGSVFRSLGLKGAFRLIIDRQSAFSDGAMRQPKHREAKKLFHTYLLALENKLQEQSWVGGDSPSYTDFASYHPIWCYHYYGGKPLILGPNLNRWFQSVGEFGHGNRCEIEQTDALDVARSSEPRALPDSIIDASPTIGTTASVAPVDYCVSPVTGTIVAMTMERIILARESTDFGTLHIHLPRAGYSVTKMHRE